MARAVWKYPIPKQREFVVSMPTGAQGLCVQVQLDSPCLWALVDTGAPLEERRFLLAGTGEDILVAPGLLRYIGTFQLRGGTLMFHLFEQL